MESARAADASVLDGMRALEVRVDMLDGEARWRQIVGYGAPSAADPDLSWTEVDGQNAQTSWVAWHDAQRGRLLASCEGRGIMEEYSDADAMRAWVRARYGSGSAVVTTVRGSRCTACPFTLQWGETQRHFAAMGDELAAASRRFAAAQ
jgi:hypothetical protein